MGLREELGDQQSQGVKTHPISTRGHTNALSPSLQHGLHSIVPPHHQREDMHHFRKVKSNLITDSGSEASKLEFESSNERPLCPKPRRLGPVIPEFITHPSCCKHSQANIDARSVLNMISEKAIDGKDSVCSGCSPSCYSGSPPRRTDNPLVHDVQFIHRIELISPITRTKLSDQYRITSASPVLSHN